MKKVKNVLLVLLTPLFVLLVLSVLSGYKEFAWEGMAFFISVIFFAQILLCIANSDKLIEPIPGYIISGTLYAFIVADMTKDYTDIFAFFAMIIFAYTLFFVSFPYIIKWAKTGKISKHKERKS